MSNCFHPFQSLTLTNQKKYIRGVNFSNDTVLRSIPFDAYYLYL